MNTTPEEKAKELVEKFKSISLLEKYNAKECAIIAVDEILFANGANGGKWNPSSDEYWKEVKENIKNMK